MRKQSLLALTVLVVALTLAINWGGHAQSTNRVNWEYKVVTAQYGAPPASLTERDLNKLGAEGWELIETRALELPQGAAREYRTDYFFKRAR